MINKEADDESKKQRMDREGGCPGGGFPYYPARLRSRFRDKGAAHDI
jgi:hypothetical protein